MQNSHNRACHLGPLLLTGIRAWTSNYIHVRQWDVTSHPSLYFNGTLVKPLLEVRACMNNYNPHQTMHLITYPCDNGCSVFIKGVPGSYCWSH